MMNANAMLKQKTNFFDPNAKISFAYLSRLENKTWKKRGVRVLGIYCTYASKVIRPSEVDWQSFKYVRVYLPIVPYIKYINTTTILHKNRPKNTRIMMPFIPVAS